MANLSRYAAPVATRWPGIDEVLASFFEPATSASWAQHPIHLDVTETPEAYIVKAEVPGVPKDQINVDVNDNNLTISVDFKQENTTDGNVLLTERTYGKASRSIRLPQPVDNGAAEAKHVDGVLRLTLPKKTAKGATRLAIS